MTAAPGWQRLIVDAEKTISPRLRSVLHHEDTLLAAAVVQTLRDDIARRAEQTTRRLLHLLNLPAGSDINRLLTHIASVERQVLELAESIEDRSAAREVTGHATGIDRGARPTPG